MKEGVLTQFLNAAADRMDDANRRIMEPGRRAAQREETSSGRQNQYARSLAGTALSRWAQMGLEQAGLRPEARILEKAPTAPEAGRAAQQFRATAGARLGRAKTGRTETAWEILQAAAETGVLLEKMTETGEQQEAEATRARLAKLCAGLLETCCRTEREHNPGSRLSQGEEARHAVEAAADGTGPEGIPGSRSQGTRKTT